MDNRGEDTNMKKIIEGKIYNSEADEIIKHWGHDAGYRDSAWESVFLHVTDNGDYYLHGKGGPNSKWGEVFEDGNVAGEDIVPLTPEEAIQWCVDNGVLTARAIEKMEFINISSRGPRGLGDD